MATLCKARRRNGFVLSTYVAVPNWIIVGFISKSTVILKPLTQWTLFQWGQKWALNREIMWKHTCFSVNVYCITPVSAHFWPPPEKGPLLPSHSSLTSTCRVRTRPFTSCEAFTLWISLQNEPIVTGIEHPGAEGRCGDVNVTIDRRSKGSTVNNCKGQEEMVADWLLNSTLKTPHDFIGHNWHVRSFYYILWLDVWHNRQIYINPLVKYFGKGLT